jgi:hypothetical protein
LVNTPSTLSFIMKVQGEVTKFEVRAEAGLVKTQDVTLGHAFDPRQKDNLPFEGSGSCGDSQLATGGSFAGNNVTINQNADSRTGAVNAVAAIRRTSPSMASMTTIRPGVMHFRAHFAQRSIPYKNFE